MTVSESFEEYAAARWPALYRTAHLLTGDPGSAEDLVQTTLVKVYARWQQVRRAESPDAYVRRMLLNELLSERRKAGRRKGRAHLVAMPEVIQDADPDQRLDQWSQLGTLPPRQRAVLVLRYYEDLSEAQIAQALGVSAGTVKSQAHAALRTLRDRISPAPTSTEVNR